VVIVGGEHMLVRSKKSNVVMVDRQVPIEVLQIIAVYMQRNKFAKNIMESRYHETLHEIYNDLLETAAGINGGFERDTWQHVCNVMPFKVLPMPAYLINQAGTFFVQRDLLTFF
jgi:hypothetical protein